MLKVSDYHSIINQLAESGLISRHSRDPALQSYQTGKNQLADYFKNNLDDSTSGEALTQFIYKEILLNDQPDV